MMLSKGASNYHLLNEYKIQVKRLVFEYGLSLALANKISKIKYADIRKELSRQREIFNSFMILDLCDILQDYLVC